MRRFLFKTLLFAVLTTITFIVVYSTVDLFYNSTKTEGSLFIWGDSQTYQGIDLNELKTKTGKKIYSAARHGAGVYDFLVFADKVPENQQVLIAISKPAQLRRKEKDRNSSGISLFALTSLLNNNYSWSEIFQIIGKNKKPSSLYMSHSTMYDYADTLIIRLL